MTVDDMCKMFIDEGFTHSQVDKTLNLIINRHPDNWRDVAETFLLALDRDLICRGNFISERGEM